MTGVQEASLSTEQGPTNRNQGEGGCELGWEENHTLTTPHLSLRWSMSSVAKVGHRPQQGQHSGDLAASRNHSSLHIPGELMQIT